MTETAPDPGLELEITDIVWRAKTGSFQVLEVLTAEGNRIVAAGEIPWEPKPGEHLLVHGTVEDHPRFGKRLRIDRAAPCAPATEAGLARYLASGIAKGIGKKSAARIVRHFSPRAHEVLARDPERILEVPGLQRDAASLLVEALRRDRARQDALVRLYSLGLGPKVAHRVWLQYGEATLEVLGSEPYRLISEIDGIGFKTADAIALQSGVARDSGQRLAAGLEEALREATDQGHVALPPATLVEKAASILDQPEARVSETLGSVIGAGRLRADAAPGDDRAMVYRPVLHEAEVEVHRRLSALADAPALAAIPYVPSADSAVELSEEQTEAVCALLSARLAILTGGPGVGKTTVLREVVASARNAGLEIALASPTGRAARRLEEATGADATTLHRLLGLLADGRSIGARAPLPADLVVVDETSMMDLVLFVRLLRKLRYGTRLILVGDPDQLPAVGPGSVLRDLIDCGRFPVRRLTRVYRQAEESLIVLGAHAVLRGDRPSFADKGSPGDLYFMTRDSPSLGAELVVDLFLSRLPARYGLNLHRDIQILTPMHRGPCGTEALNTEIQARLHADKASVRFGERVFYPGDRVMVLRNDHDRGLANGDLGVVASVAPKTRSVFVEIEEGEFEFQGQDLELIQPAYAVTVHKAQGGEYPAVILPLFPDHRMLLQRAVLYTALTRARILLVIVGTEGALRTAIADDRRVIRHGALAERLRGIERVPWSPS